MGRPKHSPVDHEEQGEEAEAEADSPHAGQGIGAVVVGQVGGLGGTSLLVGVHVGRDRGEGLLGVQVVGGVLGNVVPGTSTTSS